jgi:hypothetical protein
MTSRRENKNTQRRFKRQRLKCRNMDLDYRMEKYEKDIDRWERMEKTQNLDH